MRDRRFVAEHRGGSLTTEQHHHLMIWACDCVNHVCPLISTDLDYRLKHAIDVAYDWARGGKTVGEARSASSGAITAANESTDPVSIAVARAAGHAVATAHMADHSIAAALYALKAVMLSGGAVAAERQWQNNQLHPELVDLVLSARPAKEKALGIG